MEIVRVFEGVDQTTFGVFGPFADDESARDWAEENFPRHNWTVESLTSPS